nr:hypothetical protein Iba_chr14cCG5230 [Ipomoea batatas]
MEFATALFCCTKENRGGREYHHRAPPPPPHLTIDTVYSSWTGRGGPSRLTSALHRRCLLMLDYRTSSLPSLREEARRICLTKLLFYKLDMNITKPLSKVTGVRPRANSCPRIAHGKIQSHGRRSSPRNKGAGRAKKMALQ